MMAKRMKTLELHYPMIQFVFHERVATTVRRIARTLLSRSGSDPGKVETARNLNCNPLKIFPRF